MPEAFGPKLNAYLKANGIRYFTQKEICPAGKKANGNGPALRPAPEALWPNIVPTLEVLEWLRADIGLPIVVLSGYRDPAYNKAVGGTSGSLHMKFNAIDFHVQGVDPRTLAKKLLKHPDAGKLGIGLYAGFVHVDTRGRIGKAPARWAGRNIGAWWQPGYGQAA